MGDSISELLEAKTRTAQRLSAFFAPLWETIAHELGIGKGAGSPPKALQISHKKSVVSLKYSLICGPEGSSFVEQRSLVVRLPVGVLDRGEAAIVTYLQQAYPIRCLLCGMYQARGAVICGGMRCYDSLVWRPEVSRPQYYVELWLCATYTWA